MQHKQFTNPHYQKILEKVIKHRHPELSFEEGLEMEATQKDCFITQVFPKGEVYQIYSYKNKGLNGRKIARSYTVRNGINYYRNQINEILGRPITMCELCDVLELDFVPKVCEKNEKPCLTKFTDDVKIEIYLPAKTYYLHEQPIEIQEKIANSF